MVTVIAIPGMRAFQALEATILSPPCDGKTVEYGVGIAFAMRKIKPGEQVASPPA
jgi:hypothetical protein